MIKAAEAERQAAIVRAEAKKQAAILEAEGQKSAQIALAEAQQEKLKQEGLGPRRGGGSGRPRGSVEDRGHGLGASARH